MSVNMAAGMLAARETTRLAFPSAKTEHLHPVPAFMDANTRQRTFEGASTHPQKRTILF